MSSLWKILESIAGTAAVPVVWKAGLGDHFDIFREAFLKTLPQPAKSYPCPSECGCAHEIVRHKDGSFVAVCACEPSRCADIRLTADDVVILELNWKKLGRAISKAFGLQARDSDIGVNKAVQIAAYTGQAIPVVLTIQFDREAFKNTISALAARLRGRFILLAPTSEFIDAACQDIITGSQAGFLPLETSIILTPQGTLKPTRTPSELLAAFTPDEKGLMPEEDALRVFRIVTTLDSDCPKNSPTLLRVFRLYCMECLTAEKVARKAGCSKGTVINRLKELKKLVGDLKNIQRYTPYFKKIEKDIAGSKGSYIRGKSLIYDDSGYDKK